jgi:hypothetical protein
MFRCIYRKSKNLLIDKFLNNHRNKIQTSYMFGSVSCTHTKKRENYINRYTDKLTFFVGERTYSFFYTALKCAFKAVFFKLI